MATPTHPTHRCPVCGYPGLTEAPRPAHGGGSFELCPSCGFQFGVTDDDRGETLEGWRAAWCAKGCPWSSRGIAAPAGWNPIEQLRSVQGPSNPSRPHR